MSPTSILDGEPFTSLTNAFWSDSGTPRTSEPEARQSSTSKGSALALSMLSGTMIPIPICQNPNPNGPVGVSAEDPDSSPASFCSFSGKFTQIHSGVRYQDENFSNGFVPLRIISFSGEEIWI
ncbi:hypothetical protein SLA2020_200640 [Shorea laevis]